MGHLFFTSFLVFLMSVSLNAQEIAKVLDLMNAQELAWNAGDLEGFMIPYEKSDSLMFVGSKGITYGWQNTLERYKTSYPDKTSMGELSFNIIKSELLSPECIYVLGKWSLKKEKAASGHFTLIWKKKSGLWKIVSDHSS